MGTNFLSVHYLAENCAYIGRIEVLCRCVGPDWVLPLVMKMLSHSDLPRSAIIVFDQVIRAGPMCPHQISSTTKLPSRTVSFALNKLVSQQLLRRIPNLGDMRKPLYLVDDQRARDLKAQIDRLRAEAGLLFRPH